MPEDKDTLNEERLQELTDQEIIIHMCLRFMGSLGRIFGDAHDTAKNPVWFLNGKAEEILEDLKKRRERLAVYRAEVKDESILKLVRSALARTDQYIGSIETTLKDPALQERIAIARKRIREYLS